MADFASEEAMRRRFARDAAPINYVYLLSDEEGRPLYVGIGRGARSRHSARRYGGTAELVATGLTTAEARRVEALLIGILGRRGCDRFGILHNRSIAGKSVAQKVAERMARRAVAVALAIFFLAACAGPDFGHGMGDIAAPRTAAAPLPDKPTVPVDNPFDCPRRAGP